MTVSTPPMSWAVPPSAPVWVSSGSPTRTTTARPPADPGGGDGAAHGLAGDLPDDGAEHPAAVQGQAGQQVEGGHDEVGDHQAREQDAGDRAGLDELHRTVEDAAQDQGQERSDEGEDELAAGRLALLLDLRDAAEELELDTADRELVAQCGDRVGQFVDEHGGVEGDGEEQGDEIAGGAQLGQHAVELAAEHPGDQRGDDEPAGGDVDGHAEGPAHEQAAARLGGAFRLAVVGIGAGGRSPCAGLRPPAVAAVVHGVPSVR
ncbi:hypothetical protein M2436_001248 [Streptomyces sp. HB372]|nr:hypothetical protein [Streptomyces sp. HB372]